MDRVQRIVPLLVLLVGSMVPCAVYAGDYGQGNTDEVGLAIFPFEVERAEDRSLAFSLEDQLSRELPGLINRAVYTGRETNRALQKSIDDCTADRFCVRLLGAQFNSSLAVRVGVFRVDGAVQVETEWFTTANGLRVGRENTGFAEGDSEVLIEAFRAWWELYWDTSLRVSPDTGAGGEDSTDGSVSGETWHEQSERERREQRGDEGQSSRREDFESSGGRETLFDRSDPTGDLREIAEGDDDRRSERERYRDLDKETKKGTPPARSGSAAGRRKARSEIDLDAGKRRGNTLSSRNSAEQAGMGKREYSRYANSGLTFDTYQERRWALKKRFYLRTGGFYGGGYVLRRYFTIVFVRTGGVKTEEYGWESLGGLAASPGGTIGAGFAPIDELGIEIDVSGMYAAQSLRREYEGHDIGTNATGEGPDPQDRPSLHMVLDVRGRAFVFPRRKFKFSPGLGVTMLFMTGFEIPPEAPLNYSSRPTGVVVGLTPVVGFNVNLSPFVSLFVDVSGTVYLDQGATDDEFHEFFGGGTETEFTSAYLEPRIQVKPFMGRATVGTMILF